MNDCCCRSYFLCSQLSWFFGQTCALFFFLWDMSSNVFLWWDSLPDRHENSIGSHGFWAFSPFACPHRNVSLAAVLFFRKRDPGVSFGLLPRVILCWRSCFPGYSAECLVPSVRWLLALRCLLARSAVAPSIGSWPGIR
jgi:hypothetical protein